MRIRRILFVSAVSYSLLMVIGNLANRLAKVKRKVITKSKQVYSRIRLALEVIKHHLIYIFIGKISE